jgi:hypothetical protein
MVCIVVLILSLSFAACGSMPPQEPGTATTMVTVPDNWGFLDLPSIDHLMNPSDDYIGVTMSGDQETILAQAVAGAQRSGWEETRRKAIFDGYKVFFDGTDGSQLSITTTPRGTQVELTAVIAPPE